jgi:hypothetical protein
MLSASMWFYFERVLIPYQVADAATHNRPRGILSDLYPRWIGARELLLNGRDPYSLEVTREIQAGYYGRPIDHNRPDDPTDEQRFAYPVYVVFLLSPLVKLSFGTVQLVSVGTLALLTGLSVLWWIDVIGWRPNPTVLAACLILVLGSLAVVQGIKLQQLTLLVSALIAASLALLVRGRLFPAGMLLALATIKPQLVVMLAGAILVWVVSDWRERQGFFWGFATMMAALLAGAEYLLPGWIHRFADAVMAYQRYTGGNALADQLETHIGREVIVAAAVLGVALLSIATRMEPPRSEKFKVTCAFILAITVVVVSVAAPYNQVLLLPAIFLMLKRPKDLWRRNRLIRIFAVLTTTFVFWPWLAALALCVASLTVRPQTLQQAWAVPLWTSIGIPLAMLPLLYALSRREDQSLQQPPLHLGAVRR